MKTIYEEAKDTAKKIRKALKSEFPDVKFSVKTSTYSMGSSVYVNYDNGPAQKDVQAVCDRYKSSKFDGMQDMKITTGYIDPEDGKCYNGADYILISHFITEYADIVGGN